MDRRQGEHVTLIGPPGRGKTQCMIELSKEQAPVNAYSIFLASKRIDDTQDLLKGQGYAVAKTASEIQIEESHKWILRPTWPKGYTPDQLYAHHKREFELALMKAFEETAWTVNVDELPYLVRQLGLTKELLLLWLQGRSQANTVVCNTQRPRHVPLEAYEAATHIIFFQQHDTGEINRVAEIASFDRVRVAQAISTLSHHDFVYVNTVTQDIFITNTET